MHNYPALDKFRIRSQGRRVVFFRDNFVFDADSYFHADIGTGIRIPSIKTDRG